MNEGTPEFDGFRVLVTGASSGIGAAIAVGFGLRGAIVGCHFNANEEGVVATVAAIHKGGGDAVSLQADLSSRGAGTRVVEAAAAALGGLDVLVNNAGDMRERKPLADVDDDDLDRMVDLNVRPVVAACRAAIPLLAPGRGSIINVTSISARSGASAGGNLYAAAKSFVAGYTRGLARELAPQRIRVNAIAPGVIDTPLHARRTDPALFARLKDSIPLGRVGLAEDCAGAALYLASPALAGFVTGQTIDVNGGQWIG
ncbi:MAG: SDR family oxidoreductase [Rhizobiaceae bacterium]|nr:SDR family oxidoreductase [Rhizobiaceae bacterium]